MTGHSPPSRVYLQIRRLVIDVDALDGDGMPRDVDAQLQAAVRGLLTSGVVGPRQSRWQDALGHAVASRLGDAVPALQQGSGIATPAPVAQGE